MGNNYRHFIYKIPLRTKPNRRTFKIVPTLHYMDGSVRNEIISYI